MVDAFLCVGICFLADIKVSSSEVERLDVNSGSNPDTATPNKESEAMQMLMYELLVKG